MKKKIVLLLVLGLLMAMMAGPVLAEETDTAADVVTAADGTAVGDDAAAGAGDAAAGDDAVAEAEDADAADDTAVVGEEAPALVGNAEDVKIVVNDKVLELDAPAFIQEGRTLVPFRAIFEAVGAEVAWNPDTYVASGTLGEVAIALTIDSTEAKVNDKAVELDVAATIVNDRTFVPLRFVIENFGFKVEWDGTNYVVNIAVAAAPEAPAAGDEEVPAQPGDEKALADIVAAAVEAFAPVTAKLDFAGNIDALGGVDFTVKAEGGVDKDKKANLAVNADLGMVGKTSPKLELMTFSEILVGPADAALALLDKAVVSEDDSCYLVTVSKGACPASLKAFFDACSDDPAAMAHVTFDVTVDYVLHFDKESGQLVEVTGIEAAGEGNALGQKFPTTIKGSVVFTY